jgi:hypothetical protein
MLGIENALPHQTVKLRPRATEITRQLYLRLKAQLEQGKEERKREVARLATNLANRLNDLARPAEALASAQEAVELRRALAQQNPDAFQPVNLTSATN